MAIPKFPSQDLAKLVLGYLNDEQLMTVYDEFLQASPYLDAQKNEYDRIFMKSLRGILNEYWGVKIYVEKCKPFALRKKLSQCNGLLEVVKYLISHIDLRKIPNISPQDKNGICNNKNLIQHTSLWDRECNTCGAIQQESCVCSKRTVNNSDTSLNQTEANSSMVEATSLTDLPGSTKRKQMKVLERDCSEAERLMTCDPSDSNPAKSFNYSSSVVNTEPVAAPPGTIPEASLQYDHSLPNKLKIPADNRKENFQEFDGILNAASNNGGMTRSEYRPKPENVTSMTISAATFQDFATGVQGGTHVDMSIPDSSTSETTGNLLPTMARDKILLLNHNTNSIAGRKTQYLIHVNAKNLAVLQTSATNSPVDSKVSESKITILSDVKVDNNQVSRSRTPKMPPVLRNATSMPLMQMQTILINGTPAYKPNVHLKEKRAFTEDEIMAMPTLFVVTAPGPPPMVNTVKTTAPQKSDGVSVTSSTNVAPSLVPLTIDVDPESTKKPPGEIKNMPSLNSLSDTGLVTMVDLKNASVPKDSTISKTSTPQCLPILRKSSSTPRRNSSHVRVLDFTTPRRILNEAAGENGVKPVEIILSHSTSTHDQPMCVNSIENKSVSETVASTSTSKTDESSSKENADCPLSSKKNNWDADLRALCTQSTVDPIKPKPAKKKKLPESLKTSVENDESTKKSMKKNLSSKPKIPKLKKTNKNVVTEEPVSTVSEVKVVPVKPTFHIVTERHAAEPETKNKSSSNNQNDTPDMDRTSLQNVIGAKLNISDLLETPYKQALYDIQMETPKFLRPDIPLTDEPVSEIKISDIPTPRFFDTPGFGFAPKPGQATPSSYSSRPTDYSSGGSYYKPDDQDYAPQPEDLGFPIISTCSAELEEKDHTAVTNYKSRDRPSRPVRQCTKNVSYSDSNRPAKIDNLNDPTDTSVSSIHASKGKINDSCIVTEKKKKPIKEKRKTACKRRKSPVKKGSPPTFMKIKPRRPTPEKLTKRKSNISELPQFRKRTSSKEKTSNTTLPAIPAPTKSRRKSSTPRKLHTKVIVSPSPDSSESVKDTIKSVASSVQDSDTENVHLRWPDDDSQDANAKSNLSPVHEEEDIAKIRDYIEKSRLDKFDADKSIESVKEAGSLHKDLVLRGFDVETARSIERDLLDIPHSTHESSLSESDNKETNKLTPTAKRNTHIQIKDKVESDSSTNNLQKMQEEGEEEVEEIELSIYESNEESNFNYFVSEHVESIKRTNLEHHKLKDNFSMEFCIEEDFCVRLKTTALTFLLDQPGALDENVSIIETEEAVNSIPNYDRLYTPLKHNREAPLDNLIEVFDSSLTSLDTPLKAAGPRNNETMISEIVLEVEQIVEKDDGKGKSKKRRRIQSDSCSDESLSESKKNRREILPNIQNFDIESVLSKLHGP